MSEETLGEEIIGGLQQGLSDLELGKQVARRVMSDVRDPIGVHPCDYVGDVVALGACVRTLFEPAFPVPDGGVPWVYADTLICMARRVEHEAAWYELQGQPVAHAILMQSALSMRESAESIRAGMDGSGDFNPHTCDHPEAACKGDCGCQRCHDDYADYGPLSE